MVDAIRIGPSTPTAHAASHAVAGADALTNVPDHLHAGVAGDGGAVLPSLCEGRLTLTTAVPVTTADVTAAVTLYFTPFRGNRVSTYGGAAWSTAAFAEKSLSLAGLTANSNYDIFIVDSTLALEALIWTDGTNRATALVLQDGVYVKSGATTRRYLGTIRILAEGQTEDSVAHRFVWNATNRLQRPVQVFDATDTWTYAVAAWRQARATATNQVDYVCGLDEDMVAAQVLSAITAGAGKAGAVGVGVDSTSANSAQLFNEAVFNPATGGGGSVDAQATYRGFPGLGYHYLAWIEYARAGTVDFIGDAGVADHQSGLIAEVWA